MLLMLDEPDLLEKYGGGKYQKDTIGLMLQIISALFIVECLIKVIASGFYSSIDKKTYLQDGWNILDFVIVCFSVLTWILESTSSSDLDFVRSFRALRALRPLRVQRRRAAAAVARAGARGSARVRSQSSRGRACGVGGPAAERQRDRSGRRVRHVDGGGGEPHRRLGAAAVDG